MIFSYTILFFGIFLRSCFRSNWSTDQEVEKDPKDFLEACPDKAAILNKFSVGDLRPEFLAQFYRNNRDFFSEIHKMIRVD